MNSLREETDEGVKLDTVEGSSIEVEGACVRIVEGPETDSEGEEEKCKEDGVGTSEVSVIDEEGKEERDCTGDVPGSGGKDKERVDNDGVEGGRGGRMGLTSLSSCSGSSMEGGGLGVLCSEGISSGSDGQISAVVYSVEGSLAVLYCVEPLIETYSDSEGMLGSDAKDEMDVGVLAVAYPELACSAVT